MPRRLSLLTLVPACIAATLALHAAGREPAGERSGTVHVRAGDDLQAALNMAAPGSVVVLPRGARFEGNFVLPAHDGDAWTTLTTEGSIPERRMTAADSGSLAVLQSGGNEPALRTAAGARHWRVIGIEVAANKTPEGTAIQIGSSEATRLEDLARDVVLDRLIVRGDPDRGLKRGISMHGISLTLTRSYVADIKRSGVDTQAVWANNGPGPYVIRDNYLEASGENVMFGGDSPRIKALVPENITVEGNTIAKPLEWQKQNWNVKNLLELKSARHVEIRNNVFSGNWVAAQAGYAILFSPRDQYGDAPWTVVEDVRFEDNLITNVSSAINIAGDDSEHESQRTNHIVIRNNVVSADQTRFRGDGRFMMIGRAPQAVVIEHNTTVTNGTSWIYTYEGGSAATTDGLVVRDNIGLHNMWGFMGAGAGVGRKTLAKYYPGGVFEGNVLAGGSSSDYPPGNLFPSVDDLKAQFVDVAAGDYRLKPGSKFANRGATRQPDAPGASGGAGTTQSR